MSLQISSQREAQPWSHCDQKIAELLNHWHHKLLLSTAFIKVPTFTNFFNNFNIFTSSASWECHTSSFQNKGLCTLAVEPKLKTHRDQLFVSTKCPFWAGDHVAHLSFQHLLKKPFKAILEADDCFQRQWFTACSIFVLGKHLPTSADIFDCDSKSWGRATHIEWVKAKEDAVYPTGTQGPGKVHTQRTCPSQDVHSGMGEKPTLLVFLTA